jgi:virulence factor
MSRTPERVARVGREFGVGRTTTRLSDLLDAGLDAAFVHAPTEAHADLVGALLAAGVHVLVYKPLAPSLGVARRLVELAEQQDRSLMVGFNRRYAPSYAALTRLPRSVVIVQKHRAGLPDEPRRVVFDDFVHVVDTLRFLLPGEPTRREVRWRCTEGPDGRPLLRHLVLELSGDGFTALGIMNRDSGTTEEILEVSGRGAKLEVRNLAEVVAYPDGEPVLRRRPDWTPVARQRGIEQAVRVFLDAVRSGSTLDARDALATHELCEWIVERVDGAE